MSNKKASRQQYTTFLVYIELFISQKSIQLFFFWNQMCAFVSSYTLLSTDVTLKTGRKQNIPSTKNGKKLKERKTWRIDPFRGLVFDLSLYVYMLCRLTNQHMLSFTIFFPSPLQPFSGLFVFKYDVCIEFPFRIELFIQEMIIFKNLWDFIF